MSQSASFPSTACLTISHNVPEITQQLLKTPAQDLSSIAETTKTSGPVDRAFIQRIQMLPVFTLLESVFNIF